ncbi:MAG TPA: CAP domain-containing protein [Candidatus Saccharimonadales bacterium]|nr:CAP domain-containing protein [Candidatus Saccharimonadales bacterium]
MPVKTPRRHYSSAPRHHKHTKVYLKTYWPYLPMLLIVVIGLVLGTPRPLTHPPTNKHGVLAYATNTSVSGLLQATNNQRNANGAASLSLNSQLDSAAQTKANDMVNRNYWSHNTPDGQEPWVFIQNAGYQYTKAGENLAYGFTTSDDTITGWMNSPSHKANLLDTAFKDVGFGIANGNNFNNSGPETVVVAMYGQPKVLGENTAPASNPTSQSSTSHAAASAPSTSPAPKTTSPSTSSNKSTSDVAKPKNTNLPKTTDLTANTEPASQQITRIQTWTQGRLPWLVLAASSLGGMAALVLLLRHGLGLKRLLRGSERFILHHPLLDTVLVTMIMTSYVLTRTSGVIR